MCGRFTVLTKEELADVVDSVRRRRVPSLLSGEFASGSMQQRVQARPGSEVDVISRLGNNVVLQQLLWGFSVPWNSRPVINTRLESALGGTKMWRGPLRDGRCILPAASFFEPKSVEAQEGLEPKSVEAQEGLEPKSVEAQEGSKPKRSARRSYEFVQPDRLPLLIAGVQEEGRVSVVTTAPNDAVAPIHPRMPLLLAFQEVPLWLEGEITDIASLADRSAIALTSSPERPLRADQGQLSLF